MDTDPINTKRHDRTLTKFARGFLYFRHRHENWWELGEALMIGVVFILYFDHEEVASHEAGVVAHIIVAILLLVKVLSLIVHNYAMKYDNPHGVDSWKETMFAYFLSRRTPLTDKMKVFATRHIKPIRDEQTAVIDENDDRGIEDFAVLCHNLVQDRDDTFTIERRIKLYERWLSTKQPCLQSMHNETGELIGGSIVLPLNERGYEAFCFKGLDALDIDSHHINNINETSNRYLLVDMMAVKTKPTQALASPGFASLFRHLGRFYNTACPTAPIILCGTANQHLIGLLKDFEFQKGRREGETSIYIYKADLAHLDWYSPPVKEYYSKLISCMQGYGRRD